MEENKINGNIDWGKCMMMKINKFLLIPIFLLLNINSAYTQRCGDFFWFSFNDKNGKSVDVNDYKSLKVFTKEYDVNDRHKIYNIEVKPEIKELQSGKKVFSIRTICGLIEARIELKYKETQMTVIIKDLPGDSGNIILKDLQIDDGVYEINLNGRKLENCEQEHDTILSGNKIVEEKLWRIEKNKLTPIH